MPEPMSAEEANKHLRDPFAEMLLKRGGFPLTLRELLSAVDSFDNDPRGSPEQKGFLGR